MEEIITHDDKPVYRVAYPEEFNGSEYLVIQKKHFYDRNGVLQWRGGLWIGINDEDDVVFRVRGIINAIRNVLSAEGYELGG